MTKAPEPIYPVTLKSIRTWKVGRIRQPSPPKNVQPGNASQESRPDPILIDDHRV